VNKRSEPARFVLHLNRAPADMHPIGFEGAVEVGPLGELVQPLVVQQLRSAYAGPFRFEVRIEDAAGTFHLEREIEFLGPEARLLRDEEAQGR
jgi:hypothetical protein